MAQAQSNVMDQVVAIVGRLAENPNGKLDATNFATVLEGITDTLIAGHQKVAAMLKSLNEEGGSAQEAETADAVTPAALTHGTPAEAPATIEPVVRSEASLTSQAEQPLLPEGSPEGGARTEAAVRAPAVSAAKSTAKSLASASKPSSAKDESAAKPAAPVKAVASAPARSAAQAKPATGVSKSEPAKGSAAARSETKPETEARTAAAEASAPAATKSKSSKVSPAAVTAKAEETPTAADAKPKAASGSKAKSRPAEASATEAKADAPRLDAVTTEEAPATAQEAAVSDEHAKPASKNATAKKKLPARPPHEIVAEMGEADQEAIARKIIKEHGDARKAAQAIVDEKRRGRKPAWQKIIEDRAAAEIKKAAEYSGEIIPRAKLAEAIKAGRAETLSEASEQLTGYKFAYLSRKPFMDPEKALKGDLIVNLIDGKPRKMLSRVLVAKWDMSPEEYRAHFNLRPDYPMTAEAYKGEKRALAADQGLGKRGQTRPTAAASVETETVATERRAPASPLPAMAKALKAAPAAPAAAPRIEAEAAKPAEGSHNRRVRRRGDKAAA
jgi:predicted transcriptional regulator